MRTVTLYDPRTGELGPIISGPEEDMQVEGLFVEGAHNRMTHRVVGGAVVEREQPLPPTYNELRQKRNELLDSYRWTIMPDSPLSSENQEQWANYLKSLHALLINYSEGDLVTFPDRPELSYK